MTTLVDIWLSPKGTGTPPRITGDSGKVDRTWYEVDLKFYLSLTRREKDMILAFRSLQPDAQDTFDAAIMQLAFAGQEPVCLSS